MAARWRTDGPMRVTGRGLRAMGDDCPDEASRSLWLLCCREATEFGDATIPLLDLGDRKLTTGAIRLLDDEEDVYELTMKKTPRGREPGGVD